MSGDLHASYIVEEMRKKDENVEFFGVVGDKSIEAGVKTVNHIKNNDVMGFVEALKKYGYFNEKAHEYLEFIKKNGIETVIFVDFGGFNLKFFELLKKKILEKELQNLRMIYYIPPKVWAWGKKRIEKLKKFDDVIVIFPFEKAYYDDTLKKDKSKGLKVEYFGNPFVDKYEFSDKLGEKILLLPGSRRQEIEKFLPVIIEVIKNKSQQNIDISKEEWDSRETSWDFEKLSLIDSKDLKTAYENYCNHWRDNFVQLHKNEEELNRFFIEIYDLQYEMDEKVSFDDITILKKEANIIQIDNSITKEFSTESEKYLYDRGVSLEFNKDELVKQFLSYTVGCIMGRYSINKSGPIIANSDDMLELSENKFIVKGTDGEIRQEIDSKFLPDEFGIIPITDEKDFSNDIVEKLKEFIKIVYGEESLKDNLNFIAEALGNKDNKPSEEIIRTYFIKDFYKDHLQRYQKRPIYWLMSSKNNAFSCLFYMHRYEPLTVARVRADYLIPYQEMLENKRKFIERQLSDDDISAKEKKNIEKQLKELDTLLKELREYANEVKHIAEQKIPLDLDDGVNVNYEKLGAILKKR